jgi:hypothetical protein
MFAFVNFFDVLRGRVLAIRTIVHDASVAPKSANVLGSGIGSPQKRIRWAALRT